jgi:hypothetical protein
MGFKGVIMSLPLCKGCILGKHWMTSFPSKSNSWSIYKTTRVGTQKPLWSHANINSWWCQVLFFFFINDYFRFIIVYFIRHKKKNSFISSKCIGFLWKIKPMKKSKYFDLIIAMNLILKIVIHFVNYMK